MGQLQFSGLWISGQLNLLGNAACVQLSDCTLIPGLVASAHRRPRASRPTQRHRLSDRASLVLNRAITGPITLPISCTARICNSILDADSPSNPAFAGIDLASPGAGLHIEDSTVIGKVWTEVMRLASNTIFQARLSQQDAWNIAIQSRRTQTGCVRFCSLPWNSLTPRRYECLPPDEASEGLFEPQFVSVRFSNPAYCLLSGDAPMAIWNGADNGSQMGVYLQIQETEAVANIQIRSTEYLPVTLERGVFLVPAHRLCGSASTLRHQSTPPPPVQPNSPPPAVSVSETSETPSAPGPAIDPLASTESESILPPSETKPKRARKTQNRPGKHRTARK